MTPGRLALAALNCPGRAELSPWIDVSGDRCFRVGDEARFSEPALTIRLDDGAIAGPLPIRSLNSRWLRRKLSFLQVWTELSIFRIAATTVVWFRP